MLNQIRRITANVAELKIRNKAKVILNLADVTKVKNFIWNCCDGEILTLIGDELVSIDKILNRHVNIVDLNKSEIVVKQEKRFEYSSLYFEKHGNRFVVSFKSKGIRKRKSFSVSKFGTEGALREAKSRQRVIEHLYK